jgi:hypothetical protein
MLGTKMKQNQCTSSENEKVKILMWIDDDNMNNWTQKRVNHFHECKTDQNGSKSTDDQWARIE